MKKFLQLQISENFLPPQINLKKDLGSLSYLNKYPDPDCTLLKKALSNYLKVSPEKIAVGNGSMELMLLIYLTLFKNGGNLVLPVPTYYIYETIAKVLGVKVIKINFGPEFKVSADKILSQIDKNTKLIVLCSPNNPTGNIVPDEEIKKIIKNSKNLIVLLDGVYCELAGVDLMQFLKYQNVIVLRSFSKAFSLAGLRIGYLISNKNFIEKIEKVRKAVALFNVNSVAQLIAIKVLLNANVQKRNFQKIEDCKNFLINKLSQFKEFRIYPSKTTFVLVEIKNGLRSSYLANKLKNQEILVNDCGDFSGLPNRFLRITVSSKNNTLKLIHALRGILKK